MQIIDISFKDIDVLVYEHLVDQLVGSSGVHLCVQGNKLTTIDNLHPYITNLTCSQNSLKKLPPFNDRLKYVDCKCNEIEAIDDFNNVEMIVCSENKLETLPDSKLVAYLICDRNRLVQLPILYEGLVSLFCSHNNISELPQLPSTLRTIDFSYNNIKSLKRLPEMLNSVDMSYNMIEELGDLPLCLVGIYCEHNKLKTLPQLPIRLDVLHAGQNNIDKFGVMQINKLKNLQSLQLSTDYQITVFNRMMNINHFCSLSLDSQNIVQVMYLYKVYYYVPQRFIGCFKENYQVRDILSCDLYEKIYDDKVIKKQMINNKKKVMKMRQMIRQLKVVKDVNLNSDGVKPDGVKPDGVKPDGVNPNGVNSNGVKPDCVNSNSVNSNDVDLYGVNSNGVNSM